MSEPDHSAAGEPQRAPSKSARKREMLALQKMGEALLDLPANELAEMPLSEALRSALTLTHTVKQREARRRQLQYIGKLMRTEDTEQIAAAFVLLEDRNRLFRQRFHRLEQLRDQLIGAGDTALETLLREHPALDAQQLRQLIRQSQREAALDKPVLDKPMLDKPKTASRKLFQYLRDHLG